MPRGCLQRVSLFFFFFQAEDGIRDLYVTGVQTCALPILIVLLAGIGVGRRRTWAPRRPTPMPASRTIRTATQTALRARIEIGRASCRERVEMRVGAEPTREKDKRDVDRRDEELRNELELD